MRRGARRGWRQPKNRALFTGNFQFVRLSKELVKLKPKMGGHSAAAPTKDKGSSLNGKQPILLMCPALLLVCVSVGVSVCIQVDLLKEMLLDTVTAFFLYGGAPRSYCGVKVTPTPTHHLHIHTPTRTHRDHHDHPHTIRVERPCSRAHAPTAASSWPQANLTQRALTAC